MLVESDAGGSLDGVDVPSLEDSSGLGDSGSESLVVSLESVDGELSSSLGLGSEKTVESPDVLSVESPVVSLS
jgi:hypothetical protein